MAKSFSVGGGEGPTIFRRNVMKGASEVVTVDFSGWAEDNGDIDSVTWENVDGGGPAFADETLTGNVATARLTYNTCDYSLVRVTATAGDLKSVVHIDLRIEDPEYAGRSGVWDYGWRHGCC